MKRFKKDKNGFTLIELMVVVAIIGILSATLIPQVGTITDRARTARARGEINAIRVGLISFIDDNNGTYPGGNIRQAQDANWLNTFLSAAGRTRRYVDRTIGNDPWNTAYRYFTCNDYTNGHSFLMSRGLNRACSGGLNWATAPAGDDICIWVR